MEHALIALAGTTDALGGFLSYAIPFLIVLTVVVFFHELGHFAAARYNGISVEVFSIGFGPEITGWNDKHGTRWKISWLPLGGYVRFLDEEEDENNPVPPEDAPPGRFQDAGLTARSVVVAAGPVANFVLAAVLFAGLAGIVGERMILPVVDSVRADSAAEVAGLLPGDRILSVDDSAIDSFADMQRVVSLNPGTELSLAVARGDQTVILTATPRLEEITDNFGSTHRIGILGITSRAGEGSVIHVRHGPFAAVWIGISRTAQVLSDTLVYLWGIITGKHAADQLGGPLRIAELSGQMAEAGIVALISLTAVLSVSIGLINLFPIPLLDGGHLLFYAIEAVSGRPLPARARDIGFRIGLAMVVMLMILATWNDINRIFS